MQLLYLPYTKSDRRAFVFSLDSVVAVIMLVGVIYILLSPPFPEEKIGKLQTIQVVDDSFALLHSTGYLLSTIDSNAPSEAVQNIRAKISGLLTDNLSLRMELKQYSLDTDDCRLYKSFEECFLDRGVVTASAGPSIPEDGDVLHGRKIFMKKQAPGDCNLEYLPELMPPQGSLPSKQKAEDFELLFAPKSRGPIFLQGDDLDITFGVSVDPSGQISCDENVTITLTATVSELIRNPVDVMLIMDRSGSMSECAIANGTAIHQLSGSLGGGTRECVWWFWIWCFLYDYQNWQHLADFNITDNDAFDVLLEWSGNAGSDWHMPKMYIEAPNGTTYGYYGGTPSGGCYVSSEDNIYISVPTTRSQNGTWEIYAWNDDPAVDYNLIVKIISAPITKLQAAKNSAKSFVDSEDWTDSDQIGLVSYSSSSTLDEQLTTDREVVKDSIDDLSAGGSTATGEGIYEATDELTSPRANPNALKFQVLLSDGQTNTGRSSAGAAQDAADNNTIIYTIGFGPDADKTELQNIADITGGQYYEATDENALQEIYDLIAKQIENLASGINVGVPMLVGAVVIDYGGAEVVDGNLVFDIGTMIPGEPWVGTYVLNFPCDSRDNCGVEVITFPGEGTYFTYTDLEGVEHTIDFNASTTVDFLIRDIRVDIYTGEIVDVDYIYLDVNVFNIGDLNTAATTLDFRLDDLNGTLLKSKDVPELCGAKNPECAFYFRLYPSVAIESEGVIYAIVNDDNSIRECPIGNYDAVNCYGSPKTQYFVLDYYVWRK